MVKCKACVKEYATDRQLHAHLKAHKMRMAEYYQTYYPRHDKHDGNIIKFKSKEYYFENDFNSREHLRLWLKSQPIEVAQEYCKKLLLNRKEKKNLIFAPTQVELRTLMMPAIQIYETLFGDYNEMCKKLSLITKFKKPPKKINDHSTKKIKIYIDTREQKPLKFDVCTEIKNLKFGDYTFNYPANSQGCYIERKSTSDFIGTLSGGFKRFVNEIERAGEAGVSLIILVEENLNTCRSFNYLPYISKKIKATPEYIFHNVRYLIQAYPHVQFLFVNNRKDASTIIEKIFSHNTNYNQIDLQYCYDNKIL